MSSVCSLPSYLLLTFRCDVTNPHNPFPVYDRLTTLQEPTIRVVQEADNVKVGRFKCFFEFESFFISRFVSLDSQPFDVISIDHLPTLIPNDSSVRDLPCCFIMSHMSFVRLFLPLPGRVFQAAGTASAQPGVG